jgi:hypothetical protein
LLLIEVNEGFFPVLPVSEGMQSSVDPLNPWSVAVGKEWSIPFFWFRINQASITYLALVLTDLGDAGRIPYGPFFG